MKMVGSPSVSEARGEEPAVPRIFVVVAAYNERQTVRAVVTRLLTCYSNVVVVDDGSIDGTSHCLAGTGVYLLRHITNRGQGAALQTAIVFALSRGADVIVTFDADGQHDERDIEALIHPILTGQCDVVLGSRFLGSTVDIPVTRFLLLKVAVLFSRVFSGIRISDTHNGLRAFSRRAAESLTITVDRMGHAAEVLDFIRRGRWRYQEVPVTIRYSGYSLARGQSSWNALTIGAQVVLKRLYR
jgi:glycosyltransferase involved in cell wall biosynthesis